MSTTRPTSAQPGHIVIAGAIGDLGSRMAEALVEQGLQATALVRPGTEPAALVRLRGTGAEPLPVGMADTAALRQAMSDARYIVSTLNGLEPVIIGVQGRLLEAAADRYGTRPWTSARDVLAER